MRNVELHVSPAEDLPLSAGSCDLVTCARSWQLLDAEKFYKEATRVLRQPGVLAVYSYGIPFFPHNQKATNVVRAFHTETLSKAWPPNMRHIVNQYKEVELPYSVTERQDITQNKPIPLSQFAAFQLIQLTASTILHHMTTKTFINSYCFLLVCTCIHVRTHSPTNPSCQFISPPIYTPSIH